MGLFGQGQSSVDAILSIITNLGQGDVPDTLRGPLTALVDNQAAGLGLVIGLALALFTASGYVNAFSRAMNRIHEVDEGRPVWKLRPQMVLITIVALVLIAAALLIITLSGGLAEQVGALIGLGPIAVTVWSIVKWPVLVAIVALVIAIIAWVLASLGFGLYVSNFGNYDSPTCGALGGVIVFLLWLWITNNALLFGAEVNAEIERGRQLQAGMAAEEDVQLPPRDTRASDKKARQEAKDVETAKALRLSAGRHDDLDTAEAAETATAAATASKGNGRGAHRL